jgi:hypothetical protein
MYGSSAELQNWVKFASVDRLVFVLDTRVVWFFGSVVKEFVIWVFGTVVEEFDRLFGMVDTMVVWFL